MTDPTRNPEDLIRQLSRRTMLRNAVIAATGIALAPPMLTGCYKDVWSLIPGRDGQGSVANPPLTQAELEIAAGNLNRIRALMNDFYDMNFKYDLTVLEDLSSTIQNPSWTNFLVDIFIDIAVGIASAAAVATGNVAVIPAFAFISAFLHDWGIGKDRPLDLAGVNGFFGDYQGAQLKMQTAIDKHFGFLTEVTDNYANLRAAWKDPIVFNDKPYVLADLAKMYFPDKKDHSVEYYKIYDPMVLHHQKSVWNLATMRCCQLYRHYSFNVTTDTTPAGVLLSWARNEFYTKYKGSYVRAELASYNTEDQTIDWTVYQYDLGIGGNPFPDAASNVLFVDDTPGHIINPNGLFNRSYVFEQFSVTKPALIYGHELGDDGIGNLNPNADDWTFTGGLFPDLIKK